MNAKRTNKVIILMGEKQVSFGRINFKFYDFL